MRKLTLSICGIFAEMSAFTFAVHQPCIMPNLTRFLFCNNMELYSLSCYFRSRTLVVQDALSTHIWWIRTPPLLTLLGLRRVPRTASSSNRRQGEYETCSIGLQCRRGRHELPSGCIQVQTQLKYWTVFTFSIHIPFCVFL